MNRFISAMPSSMCWPLGENSQLKVEAMRSLLNVSAIDFAREQPAPVHPGSEIGRDRDVGRGGDDAGRKLGLLLAELVEQRAEAGLRRHGRLDGDREVVRHVDRAAPGAGARRARRTARGRDRPCSSVGRRGEPLELVPFVARPDVHGGAEAVHLLRRHQAGVVVLVAGEGEAEALDGVADETGRPVVVDRAERLDQRGQVMPGEIGHQARKLVVGARLDQLRHRALVADVVEQALAPGRAALEHQRRVELVRALVDPCRAGARRPARGTPPRAASRI